MEWFRRGPARARRSSTRRSTNRPKSIAGNPPGFPAFPSLVFRFEPWAASAARLLVRALVREGEFEFEQSLLAPQPTVVAVERAISTHDAVAGHDHRHRIRRAGSADGPRAPRSAKPR